ncbi:hypothetical protein EMCRGX_G003359 [Ephydatia muelleri]
MAIVQAWSNQSARHPGILHLLHTLFFITAKHGFIVRLVDLPGKLNCIADRCSLPQPVVTVLCPCPTGQPTANPSTSSAGRALSRQMEKLLSRALAPSTFNTYQTGIRRYYDFCSTHHRKPLPGTARTLALFVTDLSMNLQPGTIQVYISAVSYLHHMNGHRSPASNNPMIKLLVQVIERSMPAAHLKPKRQPITNKMLGQMLSQLDRDHKPSHDRLMLKAAITLDFFGLLRVRTALTARALRLVLHHLICKCGYSTKLYNTHSLRIGASTAAAGSGLPPATIKNLSRWRSEATRCTRVTL